MSALREIYDELLGLPAEARAEWFAARAIDAQLRDRVEALLIAPGRSPHPLDLPAKERLARLATR